jgi:hypothetical protein
VQLKFKAAKAMYRAFKSQVQPKPGDQNMQLIKTLMTDCINQYNNLLPQLDMLAVHHGLPLFYEGGEVDETTSLRLEAAQSRRRQELDVNLTEHLKDVHTYIANQTQVQNTGLQRRYEHQEKCLGTREEELGESRQSVRTEIDKRRIVQQKLSKFGCCTIKQTKQEE